MFQISWKGLVLILVLEEKPKHPKDKEIKKKKQGIFYFFPEKVQGTQVDINGRHSGVQGDAWDWYQWINSPMVFVWSKDELQWTLAGDYVIRQIGLPYVRPDDLWLNWAIPALSLSWSPCFDSPPLLLSFLCCFPGIRKTYLEDAELTYRPSISPQASQRPNWFSLKENDVKLLKARNKPKATLTVKYIRSFESFSSHT